MIQVTIGGTRCNIFTSWGELTVEDGQRIIPHTNAHFYKRLSAHTGLEEEYLKDCDLSDDEVKTLLDLMSWDQVVVASLIDPNPKSIHFYNADWIQDWTIRIPQTDAAFKNRVMRVPPSAAIQPVGSKIDFDNWVTSYVNNAGGNENEATLALISRIHYAIAVYLQPVYFESVYDSDQAELLAKIALRCKFIEGLSVAAFFLTRHQNLHGSKAKSSDTSQQPKKFRQGLTGSTALDSLDMLIN